MHTSSTRALNSTPCQLLTQMEIVVTLDPANITHSEEPPHFAVRLRYKLLKKLIKQRITEHQLTSIFQTGTFKKCIRDDLAGINACW